MRASNDAVADLVPVDVVINAMLAAAWYSGSQTVNRFKKKKKSPLSFSYNVNSGGFTAELFLLLQAKKHPGLQLYHRRN